MRTSEHNRSQGFTIVELMITVFVMVILAGVVVPAASPDVDRKLDTLQMEVQDAIDHAQAIAYHTGQKMGVLFNTNDNWLVVINETGVPFEDPLTHKWYLVDFDAPDQPGNIHVDYVAFGPAGRPVVLFNSKGELSYSGQIRIRASGQQRWFSVNTATGKLESVPIGT
jgi:prepilin-type N-terminal cleavage/methylation domain-containing protein